MQRHRGPLMCITKQKKLTRKGCALYDFIMESGQGRSMETVKDERLPGVREDG